MVQQVDVLGLGGPQDHVPKIVAEGGPADEGGQPFPGVAQQELGVLRQRPHRRQGVHGDVGAHLTARVLVAMARAAGLEKQDFPIPQPGGELLGPGRRGPPGGVGDDDILLQGGHLMRRG